MAMFDHRRVDWFETTIQLGFMVYIVTTVIIWIENRFKIGGHHFVSHCWMPINSFNPLSNTIDMEPSTRELASYSNQYNGFKTFFARACHIVRPNILGGSSHLATGQYLSFNLPITYMIYAMYIYTHSFIHIYIQYYLFHFCFGCHGQQCSVRPRSEEFMSNAAWRKRTYIHIHIYITRLCIYIYIHNMYEITPPIGDFYSAQGLI